MSTFKNAAPGFITTVALGSLTKVIAKFSRIARRFVVLGETLEYVSWVKATYNPRKGLKLKRESLWKEILREISQDKQSSGFLFLEFGVAWGYATQYFVSRMPTQVEFMWFGFDRFVGLPHAWREHSEGAFDAQGRTPDISDERIKFEVGDVEDKFNVLTHLDPYKDSRKIILFDLDIFEPSLFAWKLIEPHLSTGDMIYFDESFDEDERKLLVDYINKSSKAKFEIIGYTHFGLALKVV